MQQNSKKSKYGRNCLPYWFLMGLREAEETAVKQGSSRKIREMWQP